MLAWAAIPMSCRTGAGLWGDHVISVLLAIQDQHHLTSEPVKIWHLRGLLAVVMEGNQLLYGFPVLSDRAS